MQSTVNKHLWISQCLPYNSDDYKNYDYLEGTKDRSFRLLCHLFDYIYLLILPLTEKQDKDQIIAHYTSFFSNSAEFRGITKLNNLRQNDWIDYFMTHVLYDMEQIKKNLNV